MKFAPASPPADILLTGLWALVPEMRRRAGPLDEAEAFPAADLAALAGIGVLDAPFPVRSGGLGAGTTPDGAPVLLDILRALGQGNPAVGRLIEAHVNAICLAARHGQADALPRGMLFGLWVTDAPDAPLHMEGDTLRGAKAPCSGAGHVGRALVSVETPDGVRMAVICPDAAVIDPMRGALHGMRAASNGRVDLTGLPVRELVWIGGPGDYLQEPDFSGGAWRTTAVTLGALESLIEELRLQLLARGHDAAVPQQERFGQAWIAMETARLWTMQAMEAAERSSEPIADRVARVNLARIAVETASLDAIRLVQRSLGLGAFLRGNPVERMMRDLGTYLRQPAPDAVLTEAAAHMMTRPIGAHR